jgi:DNA-binding GntR family transcriptional regulator
MRADEPELGAAAAFELQRSSLADQAYTKLRQAIVTGLLGPGERLIERQLSVRMGASRTPLREAMIRLGHEGLLEALPSGGFVVPSLDEQEVRELYAIRTALEGYASRLAAERRGEDAIRELSEIVAREEDSLEPPPDLRLLEELNHLFHRTLYAASGMSRLADAIEGYRQQAVTHRIYDIYKHDEVRRGVSQHAELLEAVAARDAELAEALMRRHIEHGCAIVMERRIARYRTLGAGSERAGEIA